MLYLKHALHNKFLIYPGAFYESSSFWISKMTAKQHCSCFRPDSVYQNNLFGSHNTRHFTILIIISPPGHIIDVTVRVPGTQTHSPSGVSSENYSEPNIREQRSGLRTETTVIRES